MPLPSYKPGQALEYVQKQQWRHRLTGDQINLEVCPFCGKGGWKFYISHSKGLWDCKSASCGRKGNYWILLRDLGDLDGMLARSLKHRTDKTDYGEKGKRRSISEFLPYEIAMADSPEVQTYLTERGITMDTARAWHLGVKEQDGGKALMIPYIISGEIADVKYRSLPPAPKKYWRMGGGDSILYGEHLLNETPVEEGAEKRLYLCEGEIDALTLWQHGYRPVLSTTTGAASFAARWYDVIKAFHPETLVIVYDSDVAGQKGAEDLQKKFGDEFAIKNVVLPVKDVNEFFQKHSNDEFDALVAAADTQEDDRIVTIDTALDQLEAKLFLSESAFDGFPSQFTELNALIAGGYWRSQLTTLSGPSGTGKTSLLLQELWWLAETERTPTYLICLEMPVEMMTRKLLEHRFHKDKLTVTHGDIQQWRPQLTKVPFHMADRRAGRKMEDIEKVIRLAVKRYDVRVIGFDNINFFVRSRTHQTEEIGIAMQMLKDLAVELGIAFINVAQPKKIDTEERVMTGNDLAFAAAIEQDSDTIIILHRRRIATSAKDVGKSAAFKGNKSPYTLCRVDKARYSAGGEFYLYFDGAISTYRPLNEEELERMAGRD